MVPIANPDGYFVSEAVTNSYFEKKKKFKVKEWHIGRQPTKGMFLKC